MENTVSNSSKVPRAKFLGSVGLFCFSNICRFSIFKDPFATITHLSELYFRFGRSILLVQTNKNLWYLWTMAAAQAAENNRNEWGLTWYLWWGIHTLVSTWFHSLNSLVAEEALSLRISFHGTSLKWSRRISQTIPISTRIVMCYVMKRGIPF